LDVLKSDQVDLLKNAIESINVGVEDSLSSDPARLRSAVRNIHSGILLLYKEALRRLSPPNSNEALLKSDVRPIRNPDGSVVFVGWRDKTVDLQQIKERFKSLGITTDWERFDRVSKVRNDIEHYFPRVSEAQLKEVIANAFVLARDFVVKELGEDPRALLGEDSWVQMLAVSEIYERERQECEDLLNSVEWESDALANGVSDVECESCGSPLLRPVAGLARYDESAELECRACGQRTEAQSFVPRAIASALSHEMHLSYHDGNETPYVACPECFEETYVIEEGQCAHCGHEAEHTCIRCSSTIPPEELGSSPMCGYCDHVMSKDD